MCVPVKIWESGIQSLGNSVKQVMCDSFPGAGAWGFWPRLSVSVHPASVGCTNFFGGHAGTWAQFWGYTGYTGNTQVIGEVCVWAGALVFIVLLIFRQNRWASTLVSAQFQHRTRFHCGVSHLFKRNGALNARLFPVQKIPPVAQPGQPSIPGP